MKAVENRTMRVCSSGRGEGGGGGVRDWITREVKKKNNKKKKQEEEKKKNNHHKTPSDHD